MYEYIVSQSDTTQKINLPIMLKH